MPFAPNVQLGANKGGHSERLANVVMIFRFLPQKRAESVLF